VPERDIRAELKRRVEALGGEQRAVAYLGRAHCPDVLVLAPLGSLLAAYLVGGHTGAHVMVETKAPDGKPNDGQLREHVRLRAAGFVVLVISTWSQLDAWIPE
jgi:hypothetical protein